ncbi:hypothetical protein IFR05_008600 [Cadophora sp. M221]|nr:hypothetical protein IFR05_008600 [Cadophora sp. M221]
MGMSSFQEVSFKSLDGLNLHGHLYPAATKGPAIILTPGFACVKEMFVPSLAEAFQDAAVYGRYKPYTFWGFSFAGMVALSAVALDRRPAQSYPNEPFCLPVLTSKGENPAGFGGKTKAEDYGTVLNAHKAVPTYKNSMTLQMYYKIMVWQPFGLVKCVAPTPGSGD